MKNWIVSLFVAVFISGCSTTPETLNPHPEKYTFQVISIEIPEAISLEISSDVESLIQHPAAEIIKYPVVVAGMGESVTNDQTRSVLLAEDYNVVDGKAVAKEKIQKLGYLVSIQVNEIKNGAVNYHLDAQFKEVVGYDEYNLGGDIAVKMPYMESRGINTDLQQNSNSWVMLGGLVDERSDGTRMSYTMGVRIIPPAEDH